MLDVVMAAVLSIVILGCADILPKNSRGNREIFPIFGALSFKGKCCRCETGRRETEEVIARKAAKVRRGGSEFSRNPRPENPIPSSNLLRVLAPLRDDKISPADYRRLSHCVTAKCDHEECSVNLRMTGVGRARLLPSRQCGCGERLGGSLALPVASKVHGTRDRRVHSRNAGRFFSNETPEGLRIALPGAIRLRRFMAIFSQTLAEQSLPRPNQSDTNCA